VRIEPARTLDLSPLRELFNEGFSDYLLPLQLDDGAFRDHVDGNHIDLDCSQVVIVDRPAALALIARRGASAWVGVWERHRRIAGAVSATARSQRGSRPPAGRAARRSGSR
jgi:hypothetical protein